LVDSLVQAKRRRARSAAKSPGEAQTAYEPGIPESFPAQKAGFGHAGKRNI